MIQTALPTSSTTTPLGVMAKMGTAELGTFCVALVALAPADSCLGGKLELDFENMLSFKFLFPTWFQVASFCPMTNVYD